MGGVGMTLWLGIDSFRRGVVELLERVFVLVYRVPYEGRNRLA